MKRLLVVLGFLTVVFLASATEASALSSWSLLTEREWAPEIFGFEDIPGDSRDETFFFGAEKRWNSRFSGFVGLGTDNRGVSGFIDRRSTMAGFSFDAAPGVSLYLEFEEKTVDDGPGEPGDQVVTFRTVITF